MAKVKRAETLRILFVGDVVGKPGRAMCSKWLPRLKIEHSVDTIIVNGENSSNCGKGINAKSVAEIFESGANLVTTGNHIWRFKDFYAYLDKTDKVTRPANFPSGCPGRGFAFCDVGDTTIAVLNLQGRVFFKEHLECPFRTAETLLLYLKSKADIVVVDFHSEATSEKEIMGFFLDGKVSAILGTHT
ncbi:YmdB family metallophosphoesterase, partial [Candidatus Babeliales bacterium]|nr:YmdB family metallophosphoesterase [Candidatus Babeliales bacterium]